MAADYKRIGRLLRILTLLQGDHGWTPDRLAVELKVGVRSIYRDLSVLKNLDIPCSWDGEKKEYGVRRDFFLPAVQLTFEESLALVALAEHCAGVDKLPFTEPAVTAIQKVRCGLPPKVQDELRLLDDHVAVHLAAVSPPEGTKDVYRVMQQAIAAKRVLSCRYDSLAKSGDAEFIFKPYMLLFSQRAWYVIGHHGRRKEVRCLKLNRFTQCKLTEHSYEIPKDFSLKKHLGNAWRMIRGEKTYDVELLFDAKFADTISDTHWHSTQETDSRPDGSMIFRCKVDGLDEIIWWILSMGPHCVVKKPRELAERVRDLVQAAAKNYGKA